MDLMAFQWHYKGCSCCGAVVPDSRGEVSPGEEGECQLCQQPRVLLDGPPEGYFDIEMQVDTRGRAQKPRSVWISRWQERPVADRCPHERKLVRVK
jgi:hypothetical protein